MNTQAFRVLLEHLFFKSIKAISVRKCTEISSSTTFHIGFRHWWTSSCHVCHVLCCMAGERCDQETTHNQEEDADRMHSCQPQSHRARSQSPWKCWRTTWRSLNDLNTALNSNAAILNWLALNYVEVVGSCNPWWSMVIHGDPWILTANGSPWHIPTQRKTCKTFQSHRSRRRTGASKALPQTPNQTMVHATGNP